jgi:dihydrofolate reductase
MRFGLHRSTIQSRTGEKHPQKIASAFIFQSVEWRPFMPVTCDLSISLDGFVAGPHQSLENPLGERGRSLHGWRFHDLDNNGAEFAAMSNHGAYIIGRNMFGPGRGEWDPGWRGWWGEEPPYKAPVFVLTHFARAPLIMQGGTSFTFVTDGIVSALRQARAAAGGKSIGVHGGADTVRQYLLAGLIEELRLHIAPVLLGSGENLFTGLRDIRLEPISARHTALVTHVTYRVLT